MRYLGLILLYILAVFTPLPVFLCAVFLYAVFFDDQWPILIALFIDVQFSTFAHVLPWYVIGAGVTLMVAYIVQPYLRVAPRV